MTNSVNEQIGANLTQYRGEMSQVALAEKMTALGHSWAQATVWSIEKGKRPLKLNEAMDLANLLKISVIDLATSGESAKVVNFMRSDMQRLVSKWEAVRDAVAALIQARSTYGVPAYLGDEFTAENLEDVPADIQKDHLDYFNQLTEWDAILDALLSFGVYEGVELSRKNATIIKALRRAVKEADLDLTAEQMRERLTSAYPDLYSFADIDSTTNE